MILEKVVGMMHLPAKIPEASSLKLEAHTLPGLVAHDRSLNHGYRVV
jgi:hypothetical protein